MIDDTPMFTATGRAECVDITAYASHVRYVEYVGGKLSGSTMDAIVGILNQIKDLAGLF